MVSANELKKKMYITVDGHPYKVLEVTFATPSARGASTMVKVRLRNLANGTVQDKNFRTGEKFEEPDVELVPASFLYSDPEGWHFMEEASYEQFSLPPEKLEDIRPYLKEGVPVQALKCDGRILSLELPPYVELKVTSTEPGLKGTSASGSGTKKATLETGIEVRVPQYIQEGDIVRVNTETGEAGGRA